MKTDRSLVQLSGAHSLKHPPGLTVSLSWKLQECCFFHHFSFFSFYQGKPVANFLCNFIKSIKMIYLKDTFRSNCMYNKYPKSPLVSFNDLIIYSKDLKFPEGSTHHLAESNVWKVIHLCTAVLVLEKIAWGWSMQKLKNWLILTSAVMNFPTEFSASIFEPKGLYSVTSPVFCCSDKSIYICLCPCISPHWWGHSTCCTLWDSFKDLQSSVVMGTLSCHGITPSMAVWLSLRISARLW